MLEAPIKINPEVKALWTEALRSGEHVQGTQRLHFVTGEKCCLGVLCHLYAKSFPSDIKLEVEQTPWGATNRYDGQIAFPPNKVLIWAGLMKAPEMDEIPDRDDEFRYNETMLSLSVMNDVQNKTFAEIADHIEVNL